MLSTFGHCVKYIRVVSANYHRAFLDSYSIELGTSLSRGVKIGQSAWRKINKNDSKKPCLLELFSH